MILACAGDELWDGEMRRCDLGARGVLLVRLGGAVHAYEDRCAHLGVRLSDGQLEGCLVRCAAHHWEFDARSGQGINPRQAQLRPVPVAEYGGHIYVGVEEPLGRPVR